jgi:hypothetical protein
MQECNSPRNSRRKLIKTMRLGAEPELASPRILRPNIGLIDLRMPKKLKPIQLFHHIWRRQPGGLKVFSSSFPSSAEIGKNLFRFR